MDRPASLLPPDFDYKALFDGIMRHLPEGLVVALPPDVKIVAISLKGQSIAGQDEAALLGITVGEHSSKWRLYYPDGETRIPLEALPLTRATLKGEVVENEELVIRRPDGSNRHVLCTAAPITDEDAHVCWGIVAWRDITDLRKAERDLAEERRLALEAKDLLLAEAQHRVKNNLSMVASMLRLQAQTAGDENTSGQFIAAAHRVTVLSHLYEQLAHTDGQTVSASDYLRTLAATLESALTQPDKPLTITVEADDIMVPTAVATDLGMITNELLTNACKYGAGTNDSCVVTLRLKLMDGVIFLDVQDSGPGFARDFDINKVTSLGMKLVRALVQRHGGTITVSGENGAKVSLSFPLPQ